MVKQDTQQYGAPWRVRVILAAGMLCLLAVSASAGPKVVKKQLVYGEPGGTKLRMTLCYPKEAGSGPRPGIVLIHGGSWLFGTRHQLHWYARRFALHGYVVASIGYRMMPKHGFPECLYDCKAAVRWMRLHASEYGIDPNRIAVLGNSAGGHLAAMLATTRPENSLEGPENPGVSSAVQAAVLLYVVFDLTYYRSPRGWMSWGHFVSAFVTKFAGRAASGADAVASASPMSYIGPHTCPTLLVHGVKDHWVPYAQSVAFYEQLQRLGVPSQLIKVPYGHAFDFFHHPARRAVFEEILNFLGQHLDTASR